MTDRTAAYHRSRSRVSDLVRSLDEAELRRPVPACPAWDVHDLVAHVAGMAEELSAGRYPSGDVDAWLDEVVASRRGVPPAELLAAWAATEGRIEPIVDGAGGRMLGDLLTHEQDLYGALGRVGAREEPELGDLVRIGLDLLGVEAAGLAPLTVDAGGTRWQSHGGEPACTLHVDAWEAGRVLLSRRTAAELRATPATGEVEPYARLIAAHSPLPEASLGER